MSIARKLLGGATAGDTYVDDVFSTYVYTGEGGTKTITNGIDLDGEGGMVWIKDRTYAFDNLLYDTERGVGKGLSSNLTTPENNDLSGLSSFNNNGFKLGSWSDVNYNGHDFVSWTFRKAPKFFDVVTYVGNGQAGQTISHDLEQEPGFIIVKGTSSASQWRCYHRGLYSPGDSIADKYMLLNEDGPVNTTGGESAWNNVFPTSTEFTAGVNVNASGSEYVAYVFAHDDSDEGLIQCGTYDGVASPAKPEVDLGWEPQWVMIKRVDRTGNWHVVDSMRGITDGPVDEGCNPLRPSTAEVEFPFDVITLTSTGFIVNGTNGSFNSNVSGAKYIYMAIRRPNKPASEGFEADELFALGEYNGTGAEAVEQAPSGFPVDFAMHFQNYQSGPTYQYTSDRLTAGKSLVTNSNAAEVSEVQVWDSMDGVSLNNQGNTYPRLQPMWRRAPGFFDVVCYEGDYSNNTFTGIPHNLGVEPDMAWIKKRDDTYANGNWMVYLKEFGYTKNMVLNATDEVRVDNDNAFGPFEADKFRMRSYYTGTNYLGSDYIAYLFASVPGICDIGTYTGTASTQDIDCGFTTGARFILIKRTDVSGNWTFWDTERGISSGNDPFLALNNTGAQTTSLNVLTPLSSGFTVNADSANYPVINANGGTYIYMAIA